MIRVMIAIKNSEPIDSNLTGKIMRVVFNDDNCVTAKYGLSGETGEWILIPEDEPYPDECILNIPLPECILALNKEWMGKK